MSPRAELSRLLQRLLSFRWLNRPRRILLALAGMWVINAFDLGYTMLESNRVNFVELNPLAAQLLDGPHHGLVTYKAGLVLAGSVILLALRRQRLAEYSAWMLLGAYVLVAIRWNSYYVELAQSLSDPAVNVCPLTGVILP